MTTSGSDLDDRIPTLNRMGWMATNIDPHTKAFITIAQGPFLDLGCAFGNTVELALRGGLSVVACDLLEEHIHLLEKSLNKKYPKTLKTVVGHFPNTLTFKENMFGSILASRVLHFLTFDEITVSFQKAFTWLKSDGLYAVVSETPYRRNLMNFIPEYERKKREGDPFPGYIPDVATFWKSEKEFLPDQINLLDEDIVVRLMEQAGFDIFRKCSFTRTMDPTNVLHDKSNFFMVIGRKP